MQKQKIDHGATRQKKQRNHRARVKHAANPAAAGRRYCWSCDEIRSACEKPECEVKKSFERIEAVVGFDFEARWKQVGKELVFTSPRLADYEDPNGMWGEDCGKRNERSRNERSAARGEITVKDSRIT